MLGRLYAFVTRSDFHPRNFGGQRKSRPRETRKIAQLPSTFPTLPEPDSIPPDPGKMPRARAVQRVRKKSGINSTTHLPAVRTGNQARFVTWATSARGTAETPRWGGCPPIWVGQASRPAIRRPHSPGRCPGIPLSLKGCKSAIQRKAPHTDFAPPKQRKEPCQRGVCELHQCFQRKGTPAWRKKICV